LTQQRFTINGGIAVWGIELHPENIMIKGTKQRGWVRAEGPGGHLDMQK